MRIVCPCCQTDFPIEAGINDVEARNAIKRAFSLTPIGSQLLAYLQLFKPARSGTKVLCIQRRKAGGVVHDATPLEKKASTMPEDVRQQLQQFRSTKTNTSNQDQPTTGEPNGQNSHTP